MKALVALLLFFCFTGCASTEFFDGKTGYRIARFQGDYTNVTFTYGDFSFHSDVMNHSSATAAAYTGLTAIIGGIAAGVVSGSFVLK